MPTAPSFLRSAPRLHRRQLLSFTAAALVQLLTGCKKPDPAETLSSVASELATASLTANAWFKHRTPNPFTRSTLHDSRMSIADQEKTLFTEAVPPVDTASLRQSLDHAKNVIATLEQLIHQQNVIAFPAVLALLESDAKKVKDMSDRVDPSQ